MTPLSILTGPVQAGSHGEWLDSRPASDEPPSYGKGKLTRNQSLVMSRGDSPALRGFNLSRGFTLMLLGHPEFSSGLLK